MNKGMMIKTLMACTGFLLFIAVMSTPMQNFVKEKLGKEEESAQTMGDSITKKEKVMYLTFDDGPSANTEKVLDILDTYHVKATFFVTGENRDYADMIKEASKRGHAIGIHTYSHDYAQIYASSDAFLEDFRKISDLIVEQTGKKANIFRFPGGSSNTVSKKYCSGIITDLAKQLNQNGYEYFDWNAHNGDGNPSIDSSSLTTQALRETKGKEKIMMLMHDGSQNNHTVTSLEGLLKTWIDEGYTFKTIDEHAPAFHHHIAN